MTNRQSKRHLDRGRHQRDRDRPRACSHSSLWNSRRRRRRRCGQRGPKCFDGRSHLAAIGSAFDNLLTARSLMQTKHFFGLGFFARALVPMRVVRRQAGSVFGSALSWLFCAPSMRATRAWPSFPPGTATPKSISPPALPMMTTLDAYYFVEACASARRWKIYSLGAGAGAPLFPAGAGRFERMVRTTRTESSAAAQPHAGAMPQPSSTAISIGPRWCSRRCFRASS